MRTSDGKRQLTRVDLRSFFFFRHLYTLLINYSLDQEHHLLEWFVKTQRHNSSIVGLEKGRS